MRNNATANAIEREVMALKAPKCGGIPQFSLVHSIIDDDMISVTHMLSDWVEGFTRVSTFLNEFLLQSGCEGPAEGLTDTLTMISTAACARVGIEKFGKPQGFVERRWGAGALSLRGRVTVILRARMSWLDGNRPDPQRNYLLHSDIQFINTMFAPRPPAKLAVMLDWETATIRCRLYKSSLQHCRSFKRTDPCRRTIAFAAGHLTGTRGRRGNSRGTVPNCPVRRAARHTARVCGLQGSPDLPALSTRVPTEGRRLLNASVSIKLVKNDDLLKRGPPHETPRTTAI